MEFISVRLQLYSGQIVSPARTVGIHFQCEMTVLGDMIWQPAHNCISLEKSV